jgi:hypothetical protein
LNSIHTGKYFKEKIRTQPHAKVTALLLPLKIENPLNIKTLQDFTSALMKAHNVNRIPAYEYIHSKPGNNMGNNNENHYPRLL